MGRVSHARGVPGALARRLPHGSHACARNSRTRANRARPSERAENTRTCQCWHRCRHRRRQSARDYMGTLGEPHSSAPPGAAQYSRSARCAWSGAGCALGWRVLHPPSARAATKRARACRVYVNAGRAPIPLPVACQSRPCAPSGHTRERVTRCERRPENAGHIECHSVAPSNVMR